MVNHQQIKKDDCSLTKGRMKQPKIMTTLVNEEGMPLEENHIMEQHAHSYNLDSYYIAIDIATSRCSTNTWDNYIQPSVQIQAKVRGVAGSIDEQYKGMVSWDINRLRHVIQHQSPSYFPSKCTISIIVATDAGSSIEQP